MFFSESSLQESEAPDAGAELGGLELAALLRVRDAHHRARRWKRRGFFPGLQAALPRCLTTAPVLFSHPPSALGGVDTQGCCIRTLPAVLCFPHPALEAISVNLPLSGKCSPGYACQGGVKIVSSMEISCHYPFSFHMERAEVLLRARGGERSIMQFLPPCSIVLWLLSPVMTGNRILGSIWQAVSSEQLLGDSEICIRLTKASPEVTNTSNGLDGTV